MESIRKKLIAAAHALFEPQDNSRELALFGFCEADFGGNTVDVFPENELAVRLFEQMGTQWRMGFGGAVGLDYGVLFQLPRYRGIDSDEGREQVLRQIQVMESAALEWLYRQK